MENSFPDNFDRLSLDQLSELIQQFPGQPALVKEIGIKSLMQRVSGLSRALALKLHYREDPWQSGSTEKDSEILAMLFVRNRFTRKELNDLAMFCGDGGLKLFKRAVSRWEKDEVPQFTSLAIAEVMKRSDDAEDAKEGSSTMQELDSHLAEFDESYRLREVLLHDYGIESEEDWLKWKQASAIIRKQNRRLWLTPTLKARNSITKKTKALFDRAKTFRDDCWPAEVVMWDEYRRTPASQRNPNQIMTRPDGVAVWGDGEVVIYDAEGKPRRKVLSLFGNEVAEGSEPDFGQLESMVRRAYGRA